MCVVVMLKGLLGPETKMGFRILVSLVKQTLAGAVLRHDANFSLSGPIELMIGWTLLSSLGRGSSSYRSSFRSSNP